MNAHTLEGGFQDPSIDAAKAFRAIMDAMAHPGRVYTVIGAEPPLPVSKAAGVCLLTLCDHETPIYLAASHDKPATREWIAFHTGAPIAPLEESQFALGTWSSLLPLKPYSIGTPQYPDQSATLIVELPALQTHGATLRGPGIETSVQFNVPDINELQCNHRHYPMGLDFIFTAGSDVAAIPRSTEVQ